MVYSYIPSNQNKVETLSIKCVNEQVNYIIKESNKCIKNDGGFFISGSNDKTKDGFASFFHNQNLLHL